MRERCHIGNGVPRSSNLLCKGAVAHVRSDPGGVLVGVDFDSTREVIQDEMRCMGVCDAIKGMPRAEYFDGGSVCDGLLECADGVWPLDIGCTKDLIA